MDQVKYRSSVLTISVFIGCTYSFMSNRLFKASKDSLPGRLYSFSHTSLFMSAAQLPEYYGISNGFE